MKLFNRNVKLGLRYVVVGILLYTMVYVLDTAYLTAMDTAVAQTVVVSVFGAISLILKWVYENKVDE